MSEDNEPDEQQPIPDRRLELTLSVLNRCPMFSEDDGFLDLKTLVELGITLSPEEEQDEVHWTTDVRVQHS